MALIEFDTYPTVDGYAGYGPESNGRKLTKSNREIAQFSTESKERQQASNHDGFERSASKQR